MKEEPHTPRREDWLQDIHDRLADFETEAPDGLWEQISHRLETSADTDNVADTTHRIIPLWVRRTAACASYSRIFPAVLVHTCPVSISSGWHSSHRKCNFLSVLSVSDAQTEEAFFP